MTISNRTIDLHCIHCLQKKVGCFVGETGQNFLVIAKNVFTSSMHVHTSLNGEQKTAGCAAERRPQEMTGMCTNSNNNFRFREGAVLHDSCCVRRYTQDTARIRQRERTGIFRGAVSELNCEEQLVKKKGTTSRMMQSLSISMDRESGFSVCPCKSMLINETS